MGRYEASSLPYIAAILVAENPSYLRMTVFFNYAWVTCFNTSMLSHMLSKSPTCPVGC